MAKPGPKRKVGRPTDYTRQLADSICAKIADGKSLRTICKIKGFPYLATVIRWRRTNEEFKAQYEAAKDDGSDAIEEDCQDLTDSLPSKPKPAQIGKARLQIEVRQWMLSVRKPKTHGKLVNTRIGDPDGNPLATGPVLFLPDNGMNRPPEKKEKPT